MSGIVLSAAVRQNLLSLQNTAELLSTTQNRLASGKKVNTALDNPTNYFTAQGLDNRASDINNLLDGIGVTASISLTGFLTFTSNNDNASQSITTSGAAAANTVSITGTTASAIVAGSGTPVVDPNSQTIRASLVSQYNNIITQITTTSQDSSFNGINLLFGDDLKLTFNETGKSTLSVPGVTFDAAGLGLGPLTAGTDFLDNSSANAVIAKVTAASDQLRSEASALGSNLSIVQIRQDFAKNLINVLQTGSANLTLADSNEEAANSQALSTRQSIAVSALALSNQSQQSVLQLLR